MELITTAASGVFSVTTGDIDRDGDLDIIAGSDEFGDNEVTWHENVEVSHAYGAHCASF